MNAFINLLLQTTFQVLGSFAQNWPYLGISILLAVSLKLFLDPNKVSAYMIRHRQSGVIVATTAAVTTPFCSCGTTAVVLGMMASYMPWAPIIAFMVASPLTSPEELIYSAGIFGWRFAIAFFASSILLGLLGGLAGGFFESRGWLKNQARYTGAQKKAAQTGRQADETYPASPSFIPNSLALAAEPAISAPGPATFQASNFAFETGLPSTQPGQPTTAEERKAATTAAQTARVTPKIFLKETYEMTRRLLFMFLGFAFIGFFLNNLIPDAWVSALFGSGNVYSVPLAATLGLPFYINTEASLPLVRALIDGGMSQGAALAFLITGAGTSVGAIMGALAIARWRVIAVVIGTLWIGVVVFGYFYNLLLAAHLF